jgi:hypothetical protein
MTQTSRRQIPAKMVELARQLGRDASHLRFDEDIPATGLLDSAAIMELILWFGNNEASKSPGNWPSLTRSARQLNPLGVVAMVVESAN